MLQNIRDKTQGILAKIIIVVICVPFVLFGVETLLGSGGVTSVAEVNGDKITEQDLNEEIYLQKRRLISQMGDKLDSSLLDDKKLRQPALDSLVERKLLLQFANDNDMSIADEQINKLISQNPDFQENGRFSAERFRTLLGGAGLSAASYKRLYERDLLLNQLSNGVVSSGFMTDKEVAVNARFTHQTRDIRYITLSLDREKPLVTVSPEEVRAYYDNHAKEFETEESVVAEYIELKQSNFEQEISEDQIRAAYENEVAAFEAKEHRQVSHILIEVDGDTSKEQANSRMLEIKSKLAQGASFADLARQYSDDFGTKEQGGMLGELNEGVLPAPFVAAAKTLKKGEVSGIVETDAGLHLIQLTELTTDAPPAFEQRRNALANELKAAKSTPAFWAAVEELKDASFNAPDLEEPAKALKVAVSSATVKHSGGEGIFSNPAVYQKLFEEEMIKERKNSDTIQIRPDHVVVVRVKEHNPPMQIPFENAAEQARLGAIAEKAGKQLVEKSEKIMAALKAGADIEKLANENSYQWQVHLAAHRTEPGVDPELLAAAFKLPKATENTRAIDAVRSRDGNYIVLAVDNVKDGSLDSMADAEKMMIKGYMSQAAGAKEFKILESYIKSTAEIKLK